MAERKCIAVEYKKKLNGAETPQERCTSDQLYTVDKERLNNSVHVKDL